MAHVHRATTSNRSRLAWVLAISFVVFMVEIVVGLRSGSLAILADAAHMFSDVAALGLALFATWFAGRPSPPHRTYGHYRIEILAAATNAVLLAVATILVVREGLVRLRQPPDVAAVPVLCIGLLGLVANLIGVKLLHHGARHSLNVRSAYFEVLADALGSVGVLVAGACIVAFGWRRADPIISLAIAVFIVPRIWLLLREATDVLMESAPRGLDVEEVRRSLTQQEGVREVHDLHVWTITSGRVCLSAHVVTADETDRDAMIEQLNQLLRSRFGLAHTTLQVEGERVLAVSTAADGVGCDPCP